jgi:hypothetical protein
MDKTVEGAKRINDFMIRLSTFQKRSMDRLTDYVNADKGIPEHEIRTMYEMFMDLDERVARLEDLLTE